MIALVAILVVVLGGGDEAAEGPATVVPESAPVYVDVTLRPEGEAKAAAEAALGTILGSRRPRRRGDLADRGAGAAGG